MEALKGRLKSNYVPTLEESHLLERELSLSVQNTTQIQHEVDGLQNRLEKLNQQKDALDAKVIGYRGMFSPARRLVPDILQEIFLHCLPTTTNPAMSGLEAPLVLGRVCSQWRYTAYTTHALWSAIHVAVPLDSPFIRTCSNAIRAKAIAQWLSRAGVLPLSISLWAPWNSGWDPENQAGDSTVEFFLDTIGPFLTQCRSIHISVSNSLWDSFLQKYFKGDFPFLYHLDLDAGTNAHAFEVICNRLKFNKAPKLRMVSLVNYGSISVELLLPWRQLTGLTLCDETSLFPRWDPARAFPVSDALLLLSWCPSLVFCNVSLSQIGRPSSSGLTSSTMVTLPDLIGLGVQCDFDPESFFACLNTPSLRYLRYHQEAPWPGVETDMEERALHVALRPFIQRIIQPIEELQLVASHLTESDIIQCLELLPELKRLSLTSFGSESVSGMILDRFIGRPNLPHNDRATLWRLNDQNTDDGEDFGLSTDNDPCLCPRLERLRINGASFPDKMMLDFIRFRVLPDVKCGISRIHWLEIMLSPGREASPGILDEVNSLRSRSGAYLYLDFGIYRSSPRHRGYLPYKGLSSVDSDGVPTYTYNPFFGPKLVVDDWY